ncbi:hypothetical protein UlMin_001639 [Ulmus minor]
MDLGLGKSMVSSASPSRLSPLAPPFTLNRPTGQPFGLNPFVPAPSNHLDPSLSLLEEPLSELNLEGQKLSESAQPFVFTARQSHSALSAFPCENSPESVQFPFEAVQAYCDSSVASYTQSSTYGGKRERTIDVQAGVYLKKDEPSAYKSLFCEASTFGSSDSSTSLSSLSHIWSKPANFSSDFVVSDNACSSGRNSSGIKELHLLLNADGKEVNHDKTLVDKGKETEDVKSLSGKDLGPLLVENSELQITSANVPDNLTLSNPGNKACVSLESNSKYSDDDESDLDSPCWKGIQNPRQSPFRVSESSSSQFVRNESEVGTSLNPQAPQFFPSHAKGSVNYFENKFVGDYFSSFGAGEYSSINLSYKEQRFIDSHKVGSKPSGLSNATGIGYQYSNELCEPDKGLAMFQNSKSGSALNSLQTVQPCLIEDLFTTKGMPVREGQGESSAGGRKDYVHDNSTNLSGLATGCSQNLSSSGVGSLTDCDEILQCLRDLSELLVQNCSYDIDSMNEHEQEMIQHIINNLSVLIKHKAGDRKMLNLPHTGRLDYPDKTTGIHKQTNMEYQVTRTNGLVVQRELDRQSDRDWQKSYSHMSAKKTQELFSSSRDLGSERGNDVLQVFSKALKENPRIDDEIHPQTLLFKNLWLEAEAAKCSMKYENRVLRMQLEMNGSNQQNR